MSVGPVAGFVTLQLSCVVLSRGQAAAVNQRKVNTQSSMAEIRVGRESWMGEKNTAGLRFIFLLK